MPKRGKQYGPTIPEEEGEIIEGFCSQNLIAPTKLVSRVLSLVAKELKGIT